MNPEDRMRDLMKGARADDNPTEAEWEQFMNRAHRSLATRRLMVAAGAVAAVAAIVFGGSAILSDSQREPIQPGITDTAPPDPSSSPVAEPTDSAPAADQVIVEGWFVKGERLTLEHVQVDDTEAIAGAAMEMLLHGPPGPAAENGVTTTIPKGTELLDLNISDGVATVDLSEEFNSPSGSLAERARLAQVIFTLTQFDTVRGVELWIEGQPVTSFGSHGLELGDKPQTREDHEDVAPPIIVETPYAGEMVSDPITIAGTANVFEATVSWRINDDLGNEIKSGFTTALCGSGCRGAFEIKVPDLNLDKSTTVEIQVFESSAEDGSPLHLISVPVWVEAGS